MLKYFVVDRSTSYISGLFDDFTKATDFVNNLLQQERNKGARFEIVAKVAEVKRAPHPVQIKLSQVFYDA